MSVSEWEYAMAEAMAEQGGYKSVCALMRDMLTCAINARELHQMPGDTQTGAGDMGRRTLSEEIDDLYEEINGMFLDFSSAERSTGYAPSGTNVMQRREDNNIN